MLFEFEAGFGEVDVGYVEDGVGAYMPLVFAQEGKVEEEQHTDISSQVVLFHLSDVVDLVQDFQALSRRDLASHVLTSFFELLSSDVVAGSQFAEDVNEKTNSLCC